MAIDHPKAPFIVVIHTNKYAGNFERQMSGYIAGIWDEETHGGHEAAIFKDEVPEGLAEGLINKAAPQLRENGNGFTPVSIWPTPGRLNNGMGFHYDAGDPAAEEAAKLIAKESMRKYQAPHIQKCQDRLDREDFEADKPGAWTKEACLRTIETAQASIERAGESAGFPAYESVSIFLSAMPTNEEIDLMWARAKVYAEFADRLSGFGRVTDLKVTGLEVIRRTLKVSDEKVASRA